MWTFVEIISFLLILCLTFIKAIFNEKISWFSLNTFLHWSSQRRTVHTTNRELVSKNRVCMVKLRLQMFVQNLFASILTKNNRQVSFTILKLKFDRKFILLIVRLVPKIRWLISLQIFNCKFFKQIVQIVLKSFKIGCNWAE